MKKIYLLVALAAVLSGCKNEKNSEKQNTAAEKVAMTYESFGDKITADGALTEAGMVEKYGSLKPGDTLNVKFAAEVKDVCQKKGCWMKMDVGNEEAMVRFKDYAFFMPKDIAGKEVIVEGNAYVEEMSVEDQRHYAEDGGKSAEEIAAITEPKRTLAFEATGVLIPETQKQ